MTWRLVRLSLIDEHAGGWAQAWLFRDANMLQSLERCSPTRHDPSSGTPFVVLFFFFSVSSFFFFLFFFLPCAWRIRGRQCLEPVDAAEFARRLEVLTLERRAAAGTSGGTSGRFGGGLGGGLGFGRFAPVETG